MNSVTKLIRIQITPAQLTLIVAALMQAKLPGAKVLAHKLLKQVLK